MPPVPSSGECTQTEEDFRKVKNGKPAVHFLFDACPQTLTSPRVVVVISGLKHSPFLEPDGARQLVSYLYSLPHPSVILIADSIQRHSIMAVKGEGKQKISVEGAKELALQRGNLYMESISKALEEQCTAGGEGKVSLVRWDDVMIGKKDEQERILHRHFIEDKTFRKQVEKIASAFLEARTPNSRYFSERMKHAVNFPLGELGLFVGGISYQQQRYQTVIYATRDTILANTKNNMAVAMFSLVRDILSNPLYDNLKKELLAADEGAEARYGSPIFAVSEKTSARS